jgi:hypothetical protein
LWDGGVQGYFWWSESETRRNPFFVNRHVPFSCCIVGCL